MAKTKMLGAMVEDVVHESVEILADLRGVPLSEVVRAAVQQVLDGNPIDDLQRERYRKRKAKRQGTELRVGRGGKLMSRRRGDLAAKIESERYDRELCGLKVRLFCEERSTPPADFDQKKAA